VTFNQMLVHALFMLTFNFCIVDTPLEFTHVVYYEPRPSVLFSFLQDFWDGFFAAEIMTSN